MGLMTMTQRAFQFWSQKLESAPTHVTLRRNEVFYAPAKSQGIRVTAGSAWISWNGQDVLLNTNQEIPLTPNFDYPVISAAGGPLTTIELSYVPESENHL
jgi:hypothetical protein